MDFFWWQVGHSNFQSGGIPSIFLKSLPPTLPALVAPDSPLWVIQMPPPQPSISVQCCTLQVLPILLDVCCLAWLRAWRCHIQFHPLTCHCLFTRLPLPGFSILQRQGTVQAGARKGLMVPLAHLTCLLQHVPEVTNKAYWLSFANLIGTNQ